MRLRATIAPISSLLSYEQAPLEEYEANYSGGMDWQRGTCWLHGLTNAEITSIEHKWHLHFPPDYRLFLHERHSVDRPLMGYHFDDDNQLVPATYPSFYHWFTDDEDIRWAYQGLVDGLVFDAMYNWKGNPDRWRPSWAKTLPETKDEIQALVSAYIDAAPKLIPLHGHRFLLAEPCQAGNPVLSIVQSDMILYGKDLRSHFLANFNELLDASQHCPCEGGH